MFLNKTEEKMLQGDLGLAPQMAMRVLSKLGDKFGAEKMVPISSVHCVLRGADTLAKEYFERLVEMDAKVSVPTSQSCPGNGWNEQDYKLAHTPAWLAENQNRCSECMSKMGATLAFTCTPYLTGNVPRLGENVAWCESSAIIFANSILGARTERYTAYTDWLTAIAGRVPEMGRHLKENRKADVIVSIDPKIEKWQDYDYGTVGYFIGRSLGSDYTPVIENFPKTAQLGNIMQLGASMAVLGGISMYQIAGVSPEARTVDEALQGDKPRDKLMFDSTTLKKERETISANSGKVDAVLIGCPHATLAEVMRLTTLLKGRKAKAEIHLFTTRNIHQQSEDAGLNEKLRRSGVILFPGNCYGTGVRRANALGLTGIMTNSAKVFRGFGPDASTFMYGSMEECVEAAVKGEK